MSVLAHVLNLAHGLGAALLSLVVFHGAGRILVPRRWRATLRTSDHLFLSVALYTALCWVAVGSRHIPIIYVPLVLAGVVWLVASFRLRTPRVADNTVSERSRIWEWAADFSILYVIAYILIRPPAGDAYLPLTSAGNLDLVTYARYARQALDYGTPSIDSATFAYLRSPASAYLLAWQSLLFGRDPLTAAMPTIFMLAALFGMLAVEIGRTVCGLSRRISVAIACLAMCTPYFRWILSAYVLGELLGAITVLYLLGIAIDAVARRSASTSFIVGLPAGFVLLFLAQPSWPHSAGEIARGVGALLSYLSPLNLLGLPAQTPRIDSGVGAIRTAALALLPAVSLSWVGLASAIERSGILSRAGMPQIDGRLARALVVYAGVGLIAGNVTVQAVRGPAPVRRSSAWRQLDRIGAMPFRAFTMKVADEPDGLSTALALYFMPNKQAHVIGRGVSLHELPFDGVSKHEPLLILDFGCEGVGHTDTVSLRRLGCLLLEPPSMVPGDTYPFNRTFLFVNFDRMTAREAGGRWNTRPTLQINVSADPRRAPLDREMYVNFLVHPFLPAGVKPQRLVLGWGRDRHGDTEVADQQWFSIPVRSADWTGGRVWTLPVTIGFPDGRTILFREVSLTEAARGDVARPLPDSEAR